MFNFDKMPFEAKKEKRDVEENIDSLISEFPEEIQDRLWNDTAEMDSQTAHDYLVIKLIDRKNALEANELFDVPDDVVILTEHPQELIESLELSNNQRSEYFLGNGQNGEVLASVRREDVCYKILFLDRAKQLGANIAKETFMQHKASVILNELDDVAHVPRVYGYVKSEKLKAIQMEKLEGSSLQDIFKGAPLPKKFDMDSFFEKLKKSVSLLNEQGYFHRDIMNNAGNIFVGSGGEPYIIDFGSTIKSVDTEVNENGYQLVPGGLHYHANDFAGVLTLEQRVRQYLNGITA